MTLRPLIWAKDGMLMGVPSEKVIDTTISIPQNTYWYSDVIDLEQYGALGVIAKIIKVSAPSYGYIYLYFSDDPNFSYSYQTYAAAASPGSAIIFPKVGRYVRAVFQAGSIAGTYQFKVTLELTPLPLFPTVQTINQGVLPVQLELDRLSLAKSSDIPVPYRFPQVYSIAPGANTGRISIDLQNYRSVGIYIIADQNISIIIEGSTDNTNWEPYATGTATANNKYENDIDKWKHRYLGITVTNNGSATATIKVRVVASKF